MKDNPDTARLRAARYRRMLPFETLTLAEKRKRLEHIKPEWDYNPTTGELTSQRHVGRPIVQTVWRGVHFNRAAICYYLHTGVYVDPIGIYFVNGDRYDYRFSNIGVVGIQQP